VNAAESVVRLEDFGIEKLRELLGPYALVLQELPSSAAIPGSYWGECEAGLVGATLYARPDTPVHSVLHEAAHFVCMDSARRGGLNRDAGGDDAEENAVCYLQITWADALMGFGRDRMYADMDAWGYSFRLGSARCWFEQDAEDAKAWLLRFGIIDVSGSLTARRRE
jgi:hypothetical protein